MRHLRDHHFVGNIYPHRPGHGAAPVAHEVIDYSIDTYEPLTFVGFTPAHAPRHPRAPLDDRPAPGRPWVHLRGRWHRVESVCLASTNAVDRVTPYGMRSFAVTVKQRGMRPLEYAVVGSVEIERNGDLFAASAIVRQQF